MLSTVGSCQTPSQRTEYFSCSEFLSQGDTIFLLLVLQIFEYVEAKDILLFRESGCLEYFYYDLLLLHWSPVAVVVRCEERDISIIL